MTCNKILLLAMSLTLASGQRAPFAGSRPIGFPEVIKPTTEGLGNRFGEDDATTMRLPIEANGDRDLIDRLSKLPVDQQPFWFINWQAYEAHRKNPQTFPQKPNVFVDSSSSNQANQQTFSQLPTNQPSNLNQGQMNFNRPPPNVNQDQMNFNRPPPNAIQGQMNFNRPPPNANQGQMNFNRPPPNVNQAQMNFNRPPPNANQGQMSFNQANNELGNRFSDMDLARPSSSNTVQATTTTKPLTIEELYQDQRIKPIKNADGTTSWQIVDPSVVAALDKIHNTPTNV